MHGLLTASTDGTPIAEVTIAATHRPEIPDPQPLRPARPASAASRSHVRRPLPVRRWPTAAEWKRLRDCEARSAGYRTNTGNGYYGALQWDWGTWRGLWIRHGRPDLARTRPDLAAPADQDRGGVLLWAERGWQPWPACSRMLGLR